MNCHSGRRRGCQRRVTAGGGVRRRAGGEGVALPRDTGAPSGPTLEQLRRLAGLLLRRAGLPCGGVLGREAARLGGGDGAAGDRLEAVDLPGDWVSSPLPAAGASPPWGPACVPAVVAIFCRLRRRRTPQRAGRRARRAALGVPRRPSRAIGPPPGAARRTARPSARNRLNTPGLGFGAGGRQRNPTAQLDLGRKAQRESERDCEER